MEERLMSKIYGVEHDIVQFVIENVDKRALKKVHLEKLEALSKKLAYNYCQLNKSDYWKTQKKILDVLRRLKCRPEFYMVREEN
jgi:hypothetical protein